MIEPWYWVGCMLVCVNRQSKERKKERCIRIARERVEKALQYSYRDRRNKKCDMRSLWIQRINAGTRQHGVCFSFLSFFSFPFIGSIGCFLFWVLVFCLQMNVLVYWVLVALSFWICLIGSIWCIENNWDFGWKCVEWLCIFNWVAIYGGIVSNHLKLRESFSTPFWPFFHPHQVQPFSATISCAFLPAHLVFI